MNMITTFDKMMKSLPDFDSTYYNGDPQWHLLYELYDKNYCKKHGLSGNIPKKIHQIWLGGGFPAKYKTWADTWLKYNPDYEYKLWTEDDIDSLDLPHREFYDTIINYGPKSDILRYYILEKFGGVYVDTDFECLRSFNDLSYLDFYTSVGYWSHVELYPGLIACVPNHPIIQQVNKNISNTTQKEVREKGVLETTSSYFFTRQFFEIVKDCQKGIVAFPPDFFYPFPNHKGHEFENGLNYVKDFSYAVHHWAVSWNAINPKTDWVQGDKFVGIADMVYAPKNKVKDDYAKYPNTFDPTKLKPVNYVYTNVMYLGRFLRILSELPNKFVVMAHNGDQHIEKGVIGTYNNHKKIAEEPYELPDNVIKLFSTNVDVIDPRITTLPLGLENSMWGNQKREILNRYRRSKVNHKNLVYMNHNVNTNREERSLVYRKFEKETWVTTDYPTGNRDALDNYYHKITSHKFILNPWGNCFDNHRMWEAWYLKCIPITKRCVFTSFYEDMPMLIIDSWDEVTKEFLYEQYDKIIAKEWNKDKLTFAYWRNQVKSIR